MERFQRGCSSSRAGACVCRWDGDSKAGTWKEGVWMREGGRGRSSGCMQASRWQESQLHLLLPTHPRQPHSYLAGWWRAEQSYALVCATAGICLLLCSVRMLWSPAMTGVQPSQGSSVSWIPQYQNTQFPLWTHQEPPAPRRCCPWLDSSGHKARNLVSISTYCGMKKKDRRTAPQQPTSFPFYLETSEAQTQRADRSLMGEHQGAVGWIVTASQPRPSSTPAQGREQNVG